jgi:hypothetical protein
LLFLQKFESSAGFRIDIWPMNRLSSLRESEMAWEPFFVVL